MSDRLPVRVMVHESWDDVALELPADTSVADLKTLALERSRAALAPDAYEIKFRGALVIDEFQTLADLGVAPNAQLIVLSRRRQPVR